MAIGSGRKDNAEAGKDTSYSILDREVSLPVLALTDMELASPGEDRVCWVKR